MPLILVGGGVRSGKSSFALGLARQLGSRRAFIATAQPIDEEMRERIDRHRIERGADFVTFEVPRDVIAAMRNMDPIDVVVIDCLTLWLSNMVIGNTPDKEILLEVDALIQTIGSFPFNTIVVTNEVGMGLVPETDLGRRFRDLAGHAHKRLASHAEQIYFAALGVMLRLRPGPVQLVDSGFSDVSP
jgi:adenosylcobinamide kinase / adenosylcobinamide-phosphate guanylyltransferase